MRSICDSPLENRKRKVSANSKGYAQNTICCPNATFRSISCRTQSGRARLCRAEEYLGVFRRLRRASFYRRPSHRHFGLAIRRLARKVLPESSATAPRARICRQHVQFRGDQRLFLLAAATLELSPLVRGDAT